MEFLLVAIIIIYVFYLLLPTSKFKTSHKFDTGRIGEEYTFMDIKQIFNEHCIFRNLYIQKPNGQITEIDLLAIHKSGIYVFESKNYSGWIFGNSNQKNWTQSLKGGIKNQFYNPVWQNNTHIKAIRNILKQYRNITYYSYIVFSEHCTLKSVTCDQENVYILNRDHLQYSLLQNIRNSIHLLSDNDIENINKIFISIQNLGNNLKEKHLEDVQNTLINCPYCKIELIERHNSKTGERFYGCKNYPRCRYTTKELKQVR